MKSFVCTSGGKLSKAISENVEDISYSAIRKALRKKDIKVNGTRVSEDVFIKAGDRVDIYYIPAQKNMFDVLYKDDNIIVTDKNAGFTSEEVFFNLKENFGDVRFIHRLDRNTAGIMIFALNERAEKALVRGFKERDFEKIYRAEVYGKMTDKQAVLTAYLVKDALRSLVFVSDYPVKGSVQIKTGYKVLEEKENSSILEVTLYTGKTHQIRAHLAHIGHFILGDGKYGDNAVNRRLKIKTQRLTAEKLTLHFKDGVLKYLDGKTFSRKYSEDFNIVS